MIYTTINKIINLKVIAIKLTRRTEWCKHDERVLQEPSI